MEKTNQRVMITKKLLKDGLLHLLENKNIDKINVTELCRESSINRATFYTHYETPHDVLLEIEQELIQNLIAEIEKKIDRISNTNMLFTAEIICQYIYQHADLVKIMLKNVNVPALTQLLKDTSKAMTKKFLWKDLDDESLELVTAYITGGGIFMLKHWLENDIQKTPHEIAELFTNLFTDLLLIK